MSLPISSSVESLTLISQPSPCGSSLMMPGSATAPLLISTTSPETGMKSSETALTDSTVPNSSSALYTWPTSGSSRYTISPSCFCAWSVMPIVPMSPSTRTHSWLSL